MRTARLGRLIRSVEASFEIFDHTADAGIRVRAASLPGLIPPATEGLYAVIGALTPGDSNRTISIELDGPDAPTLLRDYLAEILLLFEGDGCLATRFDVAAFDEGRLAVTAQTAPVDQQRSEYHREVKAITYHALDIRAIPGGVEATIIVDI